MAPATGDGTPRGGLPATHYEGVQMMAEAVSPMVPRVSTDGNDLPALIDRASQALASARTSGEVLEAKDYAGIAYTAAKLAGRMARAKEAHDEVIAAVYRAQADAARIEARAKMRLADEYDAARERNEVAGHGGARHFKVPNGNLEKPSAEDLGLSRKDIHEARTLRDAEKASPGIIDRVLNERVEMGVEPTKAAIKEAAEIATGKHVRGTFGTGENEWYTPQEYIEAAREVLGEIDLDPATSEAAQEKVRASHIFTEADDGLVQKWHGAVWLNPPYSQPLISEFMAKIVQERVAGNCKAAITLTHNYTDTKWFQDAAKEAAAICFTRGRIKFYSPSGVIAAPTQGQAFMYFGPDTGAFRRVFSQFGLVVLV